MPFLFSCVCFSVTALWRVERPRVCMWAVRARCVAGPPQPLRRRRMAVCVWVEHWRLLHYHLLPPLPPLSARSSNGSRREGWGGVGQEGGWGVERESEEE